MNQTTQTTQTKTATQPSEAARKALDEARAVVVQYTGKTLTDSELRRMFELMNGKV